MHNLLINLIILMVFTFTLIVIIFQFSFLTIFFYRLIYINNHMKYSYQWFWLMKLCCHNKYFYFQILFYLEHMLYLLNHQKLYNFHYIYLSYICMTASNKQLLNVKQLTKIICDKWRRLFSCSKTKLTNFIANFPLFQILA